ncbi:hypothetical protein CspeluHIS016_0203190 [Cutaneotrichosporon spelunceum]|uniref:P-loop containing nucleoside triphosphate hydrolase protein n=1 Tax=Cutaneotrichosporon spelunceum TaxID=1672016 RepID=A0AAD3TRC3_9TREE|nr:hypothetical protein CspeluHIS016_0203190 [Cutaneotrichosporon spelunceum]
MTSTTDSLLAEVGTGTGAQLAMSVAYTTAPPGPTFLPELDALLLSARPHAGGSSLQRGDLVELTGASGSGKSTLLTFLLMTALLPPTLPETAVPLGGRGMRAALLSLPSHPPSRIARSMRAHIARCCAAATHSATPPEIDAVVDAALARLTVLRLRPRATPWTLALRRLLALEESPALIVADGLGDGYWPERWAEETRSAGRSVHDAGMRDIWDALTALRAQLGAVVIVTVQGLRPAGDRFKSHLPAPYPGPSDAGRKWPLSIHITLLGPARPLQLPAESTLAEALRARHQADVRTYHAVVRVPGGAGMVGTPAGARFSFGISEHGLVPFNAS